ncbi:hypothetical protein ACLKA6_001226 [Drosophila palustris]
MHAATSVRSPAEMRHKKKRDCGGGSEEKGTMTRPQLKSLPEMSGGTKEFHQVALRGSNPKESGTAQEVNRGD